MLLPKTHRNSMLPARCRKPPCRNIEVNSESEHRLRLQQAPAAEIAGQLLALGTSSGTVPTGRRTVGGNTARRGTAGRNTAARARSSGVNRKKNATIFTTINATVTWEERSVGLSSWIGIRAMRSGQHPGEDIARVPNRAKPLTKWLTVLQACVPFHAKQTSHSSADCAW